MMTRTTRGDRQTDRQTGRQADRQTGRQAELQAGRQTDDDDNDITDQHF